MARTFELHELPQATEMVMIAGWDQWADAGNVSSGLPEYLVQRLSAHFIGEIAPEGFYLFQVPGTHHLLRPFVHLEEGQIQELQGKRNEFYYHPVGEDKGLVIFRGDEPHMNEEEYAEAFFAVVRALEIRRVAIVGGVYGAMPYDKEREIACVYSLPHLREELEPYAVRFSNYQGGATIGTYLIHRAMLEGIECFAFYAMVPAYDFDQVVFLPHGGIRIEQDYKAWYDILRRFNHMFGLGIDLADLRDRSDELLAAMEAEMEELAQQAPQLNVRAYLRQLEEDFTERPFMPLDDVWSDELGDLLDSLE